jgi:WD40 repeat protein
VTDTVAVPVATAAEAPESPYKGLVPYTGFDADFFFGREREREVIAGNLLAARLTLFYGPSGVGKSSVLLAGVVEDLRKRSRENLANDAPGFAVVVVRGWRDDPIETIAAATRAAVVELIGKDDLPGPPLGASLAAVLGYWSDQLGAKVLVVFDQFEEYFLYHEHDQGPDSFDAQFPLAVNQPTLRANFLISMREDALARLDRFKGRVPNLFDNRLQIDHLTLDAARGAVVLPIEEWNRRSGPGRRVTIESALVDDVLTQVRTGLVALGSAGLGTVNGGSAESRVEAPFLQVVLTALWEAEAKRGSHMLRAQTLRELGGAETLARDRLDERIGRLGPEEQDVAAEVFQFLVTRSGTKIAHTAEDLADFAELTIEEVEPVLEKLAGDARILRTLPPPRGDGASRYEIFHDVLGPAILDWRSRHANDVRERRGRRKARILYGIAGVSVAIAVGVAGLSYLALREHNSARAEGFVAQAAMAGDPYQRVRLWQQALAAKSTPAAESAFRVAVGQSRLRLVAVHGTAVYHAFYSRDGELVLSVGGKGARVWNATTGKTLDVIAYRGSPLSGNLSEARFAAGGHAVVTAGWDGTVRLWSPPAWRGRIIARGAPPLVSASINRDGTKLLVVDGKGRVRLVSLEPPPPTTPSRPPVVSGGPFSGLPRSGIDVAEFSPNGRFVVTGSGDGVLQFRDAEGSLLRRVHAHDGAITTLSFDRDGGLLVTGSADKTARVWRVPSGAPVGGPLHEAHALDVATLAPDGGLVATAAGKVVHLWNAETGHAVGVLRGHADWVNDVEFSPDGTLAVTASGDATARVWDVPSRAELFSLEGSGSFVNTARFSPDGKSVVTSSNDGTARLWDVSTGETLRGSGSWVLDAVYTPNGKQIFTAGADGELRVWDTATLGYVTGLRLPRNQAVTDIAFDPVQSHHRFVMAVDDGTAIVRDSRTGVRLATIDEAKRTGYSGSEAELTAAAFSPDGRRIVTASVDWTASIWDARTGKHIATLVKPIWNGQKFSHAGSVEDVAYGWNGRFIVTVGDDRLARVWTADGKPTGIVFSRHRGDVLQVVSKDPENAWIVGTTSDDGTVRVWDARNGRQLAVLDAGVPLSSVAFSPNGRLLAAGSPDGYIRIWDWKQQELLSAMKLHADFVNSVAFSPDSRFILSASDDHTAKLYHCTTCGSIEALEQRVSARALPLAALDGR